jgi:hypothetical protein
MSMTTTKKFQSAFLDSTFNRKRYDNLRRHAVVTTSGRMFSLASANGLTGIAVFEITEDRFTLVSNFNTVDQAKAWIASQN